MKQILKSMFYEIKRDGTLIRLIFLTSVLFLLFPIVNYFTMSENTVHTISAMFADSPTLIVLMPSTFIGLFTAWIAGADLNDRMINYEIMGGHARWKSFFARAILATLAGALIFLFQGLLCVLLPTLIFGWGDTISLSAMILRVLFCFFPAARISAFVVMIAFLFKNKYLSMAVGYVLTVLVGIMNELVGAGTRWSYVAGFQNIMDLVSFHDRSIYNLDPSSGIVIYSSYVSKTDFSFLTVSALVSVLMTAAYLFTAYVFFRRDELK